MILLGKDSHSFHLIGEQTELQSHRKSVARYSVILIPDNLASISSLQTSPNPEEMGIKSCINCRMTWEKLSENSPASILVDHQGPLDPFKFFLEVGEPQEGPGY